MNREKKRARDRVRQRRLYAEGKSYKQLHPDNQQLCDWNRAGTLKRILSNTAAHRRETEAALAAQEVEE